MRRQCRRSRAVLGGRLLAMARRGSCACCAGLDASAGGELRVGGTCRPTDAAAHSLAPYSDLVPGLLLAGYLRGRAGPRWARYPGRGGGGSRDPGGLPATLLPTSRPLRGQGGKGGPLAISAAATRYHHATTAGTLPGTRPQPIDLWGAPWKGRGARSNLPGHPPPSPPMLQAVRCCTCTRLHRSTSTGSAAAAWRCACAGRCSKHSLGAGAARAGGKTACRAAASTLPAGRPTYCYKACNSSSTAAASKCKAPRPPACLPPLPVPCRPGH